MRVVSTELLEQYRRDGFLVVEGVFDAATMDVSPHCRAQRRWRPAAAASG